MVPAQNLFPFVTMPAFQFSIGKELSAVLSPWLVVMRVRPGHQTQTGFKISGTLLASTTAQCRWFLSLAITKDRDYEKSLLVQLQGPFVSSDMAPR